LINHRTVVPFSSVCFTPSRSVPFQWRKPLHYASPHSDSPSFRSVLLPKPSTTPSLSLLLLLLLSLAFSISLPKPPPPVTSPATIPSLFSPGPIPLTVRSSADSEFQNLRFLFNVFTLSMAIGIDSVFNKSKQKAVAFGNVYN